MDVSMEAGERALAERNAVDVQDEPNPPPTPPPPQVRYSPVPSVGETDNGPNPRAPLHQKRHGYATIEVHQGAARVLRWENIDDGENEQPLPEAIFRQKEWFELAEWLATLPINNTERARYFELERVSLFVTFFVNILI